MKLHTWEIESIQWLLLITSNAQSFKLFILNYSNQTQMFGEIVYWILTTFECIQRNLYDSYLQAPDDTFCLYV